MQKKRNNNANIFCAFSTYFEIKIPQNVEDIFSFNIEMSHANKEETLRLLEGLIKYQQPSKASTWNRQEAQAHAQR